MPRALPARPNLEWLKKTAKQQLKQLHAERADASLADAQLALAREYGFGSWRAFRRHVEERERALSTAPAPSAPLTPDQIAQGFLRLVGTGRIDEVRRILAVAPQMVNIVGPHPFWGGRPQPLHVSIETKRRDMFDLLLDAGANVDGDNTAYDRWSPLMLADSRDRADMRDELLRRGARVGLFEALMFGDDARLEELLAAVGRLPETVPNAGSPLNFARTTFAIDRLLDFGASIDTPDRWGATPLRSLSRLGTAARPLVRHLIARGACGEPEDYARLGDRQPLEELAASDPNSVRSDAVMMAAVDGGHRDLAAWLLARGASVNARALPPSRHTALHAAAWNGDLPMVELLVNAGADLGARDDEHDNTPLGWARTAIEIRNNPAGQPVVDYLARLESKESGNETGEETT